MDPWGKGEIESASWGKAVPPSPLLTKMGSCYKLGRRILGSKIEGYTVLETSGRNIPLNNPMMCEN
jgi:hypothetical protein